MVVSNYCLLSRLKHSLLRSNRFVVDIISRLDHMALKVPDRGPVLVHSMIALNILCDIAVILRFISRKIAKSRFSYDDYMAVIAMVRSLDSVLWQCR